jgi:hypothetical protein
MSKITKMCVLAPVLAGFVGSAFARFVGVDPAPVDPSNIHTFNRYAYANNNPYKFIDPDGRRAVVHTALQPVVNAMRQNSPVFSSMYDKLDQSKATYEIMPMSVTNPSTWLLSEPAEGKQVIPGTYTIGISPQIDKWKYLGEDGEKHPFSIERAIAHEVSHPALGTNNEKRVIDQENKVVNELKPSSTNRSTNAPYPIYKPEKTNASNAQ